MRKLWAVLPLLVVIGVVLIGIHPYLQMHQPIEKGVLLVEGWLPDTHLIKVAELYASGDYSEVITTGTNKPFSHYLNNQQRLELNFTKAEKLKFSLMASGVDGAHMAFIHKGDTIFDTALNKQSSSYEFESQEPVKELTIKTYSTVSTDWSFQISFINGLKVNGQDAGLLLEQVLHYDRLGQEKVLHLNYAQYAKAVLIESGIPPSAITAIDPGTCDRSSFGRTECNARSFGAFIRSGSYPITEGDLVSLGVHTRRSYANYSEQLQEGFDLGTISLEDPECPSNWISSSTGSFKVFKEVGGILFGNIIDPLAHEPNKHSSRN